MLAEEVHCSNSSLTNPDSRHSRQVLRLGTSALRPGTSSPESPNHIVGTTPSTICRMGALEDLYLRYVSGMWGTIPTCVGDLANLTSIDYTDAGSLNGTLPRGLCKLRKLQKLVMSNFQYTGGLSGTIPDCLGEDQRRLSTISFMSNNLHGPIPESLCLIGDSLNVLVLHENDLTGE